MAQNAADEAITLTPSLPFPPPMTELSVRILGIWVDSTEVTKKHRCAGRRGGGGGGGSGCASKISDTLLAVKSGGGGGESMIEEAYLERRSRGEKTLIRYSDA